ncbi:MAG: TonB-dependent receptor [Bacteroidota bacterium]|nr:TonB-dependent receptor [Bacteroidota bacterium]
MKHKCNFTFLLFLVFCIKGFSQIKVSGFISDKTGTIIPGAIIKVSTQDSIYVTGTQTDSLGNFILSLKENQKYVFNYSYFGYANRIKLVEIFNEPLQLGKIVLKESAQNLKEVEIKTTQIRGEQKGDTTQFNSDSFKTNPDANAEDLIKKMPGITSDNNGLKVNGETVQKVLVDGKPFFGDDPNATLKNIPADIIDRVEIFDKMSDQSAFSGFNDGNQQKTINLRTKKGKNVGTFGKVYAGYGTDERYNAGAAINNFNVKRRVSLLLLSNNINQQNFSASDITGAMSNTGQSSGRGGGRGGNSGSSSLLTSPQNGNSTTQSAGLNYSDAWGKKIIVSGSYFYNYTDNLNHSDITRNYFTQNGLVYNQINNDQNINQNHRGNLRLEYAIDSANKLTITPSINYQNNVAKSNLVASNILSDGKFLSNTNTNSTINNIGYDFSNSVLFQHKFSKIGRTISLNISTQLTEKNNDGTYVSINNYGDTTTSGLDQTFAAYSNSKKITGSISYTEPLNKNAQLLFNYNPSYTEALSNKSTSDYDSLMKDYVDFNASLSNKYNNVYQTQRAGLSYKYQKEKLNFTFGADAQQATLEGEQLFPVELKINKSFQTILPNAQLNYKFSKSKNLRINYRTSTNIPSTSQLQNVIDVSNPLQIKDGNSDLKQTFENNLFARFGGFDTKTSRNAMIFIRGNYVDNYISNATYVLRTDSIMQGYTVKAGSQLTKPINLNGYYTASAFFVYGFPVTALKSNLNINGGVTYNHTPSLINNVLNISDNFAYNGGAYIGSNISQNLDFSLGYNGSYNTITNSVQKSSDNNFVTHATTFKINWIFLKGFVLNTDVVYTVYNGLSQSYNQQYYLWNAYAGYKFLKNKSLEAKLSVFDILNQNRSIGRTVTGNYTEDFNTTVLKQYYMFTLTYTFKKFKSGTQPVAEEDPNPMRNMPGMPQRPGGGGH